MELVEASAIPPCCRECIPISLYTTPDERIEKLKRIAMAGSADPSVRAIAVFLAEQLRAMLGRVPTKAEVVQYLMDSLHLLVDYVPDPPGMEVFQSVRQTLAGLCGQRISTITGLRTGTGDCEDMAATLAALGLSLGIRMRPRWWAQDAPLNHVSAEADVDETGVWRPVEATLEGARFGQTPQQALATVGYHFRDRILGPQ